jgi:hypothetical protein
MSDYIQYIFWTLAAICNAAMDRLENAPAYNKSIFRSLPQQFWLKEVSWKYAAKIFGYKTDGWHFCKSLMIVFMAATVIFYTPVFRPWLNVIILGALWNITFNLFYNSIFYRK